MFLNADQQLALLFTPQGTAEPSHGGGVSMTKLGLCRLRRHLVPVCIIPGVLTKFCHLARVRVEDKYTKTPGSLSVCKMRNNQCHRVFVCVVV